MNCEDCLHYKDLDIEHGICAAHLHLVYALNTHCSSFKISDDKFIENGAQELHDTLYG